MYFFHLFLISSASIRSLPFMSFVVPIFVWNIPLIVLIFLKRSLVFLILFSALFLRTVHLRISFYLSLLFCETLHSVGYVFLFLSCLSLLFFSQLFVRLPQTTTLSSCISFSLGWFCSLLPVQWNERESVQKVMNIISSFSSLISIDLAWPMGHTDLWCGDCVLENR